MKINEIYSQYKIFAGLQIHMLRVAAVAKIICDHSKAELDTENIIAACLLHDMGNIIKSKLEKFPDFLEPEGLEYWLTVQNEFFEKYGVDEHEATVTIAQEIGVNERVIALMNLVGFSKIEFVSQTNDLAQKICNYSDMRVSPSGIVLLSERLDDLEERYKHNPKYNVESFAQNRGLLIEIEKEIFATTDITPEFIADTTATPIIEALKNYEI